MSLRLGATLMALVALALAIGDRPAQGPAPGPASPRQGATARLFGPLASVGASVQWLRFHGVLHEGDEERAYSLARSALELDPKSTEGWSYLAYHFVFDRGSRLETRSAAERRRWILAGLDVLAQGREFQATGDPARAELHFSEWLYARTLAEDDPWPGARTELGARADAALTAAAALGDPRAMAAADTARAR